jgi:hypothetical protein
MCHVCLRGAVVRAGCMKWHGMACHGMLALSLEKWRQRALVHGYGAMHAYISSPVMQQRRHAMHARMSLDRDVLASPLPPICWRRRRPRIPPVL